MNTTFKGVKQFAQQVLWNLIDTHDAILEHRVMQMHYSNKHRRPSVIYHENDMVYLSTKNLALPKGQARKLMPRFLGPYKVIKATNDSSNVTLELLPELKDRRISPMFHTDLVRPYVKNNDILFPKREAKSYYDFGNNDKQEWFIDEILVSRSEFRRSCTKQRPVEGLGARLRQLYY